MSGLSLKPGLVCIAVGCLFGSLSSVVASSESSPKIVVRMVSAEMQVALLAKNLGLPVPVNQTIKIQSQGAAELTVRLNAVEDQMRQLNGRVDQIGFILQELQDQLRRFQEDTEFRFQDLNGNQQSGQRRTGSQNTLRSGKQTVQTLGTTPTTLGTLPVQTLPGTGGPLNLGARLNLGAAPSGNNSNNGSFVSLDPRNAYDDAYGAILSGDYGSAEKRFRSFLNSNPDHQLAADAQYWLGESLYQRGQFRESAEAFLTGYKNYPDGRKTPETLLKLGMSLHRFKESSTACITFDKLASEYPSASSAIRSKLRKEQKAAGC